MDDVVLNEILGCSQIHFLKHCFQFGETNRLLYRNDKRDELLQKRENIRGNCDWEKMITHL